MEIININNNKKLVSNVIVANRIITRLRGLMFKRKFEKDTGMLIYPCNMIHTFFMKFPLDIIFISKEYEVLYAIENMLPGNISPFIRNARAVLELPLGTIERTSTKKGDFLNIIGFEK